MFIFKKDKYDRDGINKKIKINCMDNETFQKFQIFLIRSYTMLNKRLSSKKTEDEIELEFIEKYGEVLRKLNNFLFSIRKTVYK